MPRLERAKLLFLLLLTPVLLGACDDDDRTTSPQMLPNTWVFGGAGADWGGSLDTTSDGGQIIAGKTSSFGAGLDDVYLIRTDASGSEVWDTTFGGTGVERGASVVSTPDGGFVKRAGDHQRP